MTKRRDLIKQITDAAKALGILFEIDREGSKHTIYTLGGLRITIPRHAEINKMTALAILKQAAEILGEGWWK